MISYATKKVCHYIRCNYIIRSISFSIGNNGFLKRHFPCGSSECLIIYDTYFNVALEPILICQNLLSKLIDGFYNVLTNLVLFLMDFLSGTQKK